MIKTTPGFTPPVASRALGYIGLSFYESVVGGMPEMQSLHAKLPWFTMPEALQGQNNLHWPTVANNSLSAIMDSVFSNCTTLSRDSLHGLRDTYNTAFNGTLTGDLFVNSKAYGEAVAAHIWQYSKFDGGHNCQFNNFPTSYIPPAGDGLWVQTGAQSALQPYWGNNRPFVLDDTIAATLPPPFPTFSTSTTSEFYAYAYQVYNTVNTLSPADSIIALYWADGGGTVTPPGHSIAMLTQVLQNENADLAKAARAYAQLGLAVSDAFLMCWRTKYIYNLLRPVTYIQNHIDPTWSPLIGTPPFPEYVSGHSTQSGAFYTVMEELFGQYYQFTDSTHGTNFGGPRSYLSFEEAALEAMNSRLYGGIHYQFGNEEGLFLGVRIGQNINQLFRSVDHTAVAEATRISATVYPNPTTDRISVSGLFMGEIELQLSDMMGRKVITSKGLTADLSSLARGLYTLQVIQNGNPVATTRVIRE